MAASPLRAVLTGDLVASQQRDTSDRRQLSVQMRAVYAQIQERYGAAVPYPMAIFRGDSWQVYVADAAQALRIALSFRAALQAEASVDTRVGLALDTVDTVDESNVSASMGPAFQRSGQALDTLQTPRRMRCLVPEAAEDIMQLGADAVCDLADHLAIHWTDAQAQAVALRLMLTTDKSPPSQRDIAHHWQPEPITQQAVSKHLQQAAWRRLEAALNYFNWLVSYLLQNELP